MCKYCEMRNNEELGTMTGNKILHYSKVYIQEGNIISSCDGDYVKISFCPMCGEKLEATKC
jgi:hypothetical protein